MNGALTTLEHLEVALGALALVIAINLQFLHRENQPKAVFAYWALGTVMVLSHIGVFVADPTARIWLEFFAFVVILAGELIVAALVVTRRAAAPVNPTLNRGVVHG